MNYALTLFIFIFLIKDTSAQFENVDLGARTVGLNGAFTSLSDNSLSVFYNPSGLGQMKYREISVIYSPSPYGISEISTSGLTFAEPFKFGTFGFALRTFGFELYRETNAIMSFGKEFLNKLFFGLNLNYYNVDIKNYNSASAFGIDIGAMAYLSQFLKWGFFAKNVSGSTIGSSEEKIPQVYKTGFTFKPQDNLNLLLETEKDVRYPFSFKAAVEYCINDFVEFRSGIGTEPSSFSGGISLNYKMFQLDYSMHSHSELGLSNTGTLTVNFGGSKARVLAKKQLRLAFEKQ